MKALILVGGYGTRLRPLTLSVPKPLVPFANLPIVEHQIAALVGIGCTDIVLAVSYRADAVEAAVKVFEAKYNVKIIVSLETEPLGTAGPLALARAHLVDTDYFFVLNSDVICEFPFRGLLEFHKRHGKEGTIVVTKVDEPSRYGVVVSDEAGRIKQFVEKPSTYVSNRINAGIYIFTPSVLDHIEARPTSIEKEIFPKRAAAGELFCFDLPGFWMDIGEPPAFIVGTGLYLASVRHHNPENLAKGPQFIGNVLVDPSAKIGKGAVIGPNVVVGPGCVIGEGVRVARSVLLAGCKLRDHSWVNTTIVGWNSTVGMWARVENNCVLGEDVHVADEVYVNSGRVLPHKSINSNIPNGGVYM